MKSKKYLTVCVTILQLTGLWQDSSIVKDYLLIVSVMPCALPILADFLYQVIGGVYNLTALTENLIALNCINGMIYMTICYLKKRHLIKNLVSNLTHFDQFTTNTDIDKKANLHARIFLFYGIFGNVVYMTMPLLSTKQCQIEREFYDKDQGIPCGLVTRCRLPFKFDYTPVFEIVFIHQFYTCTIVTIIVLNLTMLLCGFLLHITHQLQTLRRFFTNLRISTNFDTNLRTCVKYHQEIIIYSQQVNEAFGTMMMLHLTLTSLVISALGFEILIVDNINDSLRFSMHLLGWLILLLLICYYGQSLIDESFAIAQDVYFTLWFQAPVQRQKDLLLVLIRAQKPLTLNAANIGIMSFPTFLRVISSAYSYFTLLLNIKS